MKKAFAILILSTILQFANAQNTTKVDLPQVGLKTSYLGSIIYPGFKIGIEKPYKVTVVEKQKKWGTKTILKERYWTLNLGYYHHPTFHDNLYLLAEWQMRRQKSNGWFFEFAPGLGYSRTFLGGTTYNVDDNGGVSKVSAAGYNYAMLSIAGGFGCDFSKKTGTDVKAFFKPSIIVMAPYNSFVYARPTVELGVVFSLEKFIETTPTVKMRKK
jgi:hypothetical protein